MSSATCAFAGCLPRGHQIVQSSQRAGGGLRSGAVSGGVRVGAVFRRQQRGSLTVKAAGIPTSEGERRDADAELKNFLEKQMGGESEGGAEEGAAAGAAAAGAGGAGGAAAGAAAWDVATEQEEDDEYEEEPMDGEELRLLVLGKWGKMYDTRIHQRRDSLNKLQLYLQAGAYTCPLLSST